MDQGIIITAGSSEREEVLVYKIRLSKIIFIKSFLFDGNRFIFRIHQIDRETYVTICTEDEEFHKQNIFKRKVQKKKNTSFYLFQKDILFEYKFKYSGELFWVEYAVGYACGRNNLSQRRMNRSIYRPDISGQFMSAIHFNFISNAIKAELNQN